VGVMHCHRRSAVQRDLPVEVDWSLQAAVMNMNTLVRMNEPISLEASSRIFEVSSWK
jgi:hypothetical protein